MEKADYIRPNDTVEITVVGPDSNVLYSSTVTGFRSIEVLIQSVIPEIGDVNPESCVFDITNTETSVSHRYRLNAHGNVKLIV